MVKFRTSENAKVISDRIWKYIERPKRILHSKLSIKRDNAYLIQKEANKWRGEIMLNHNTLARLIGWTDAFEEDYYWILMERDKEGTPRIVYSSCVGSPIRLRKALSPFNYWMLDNQAAMNFLDIESGIALCEAAKITIK